MNTASKIRLGIIGIGNMGASHARSILEGKCPDFVLTAIADTNPDRLAWGKETLSSALACFDTAEAMLDSGCIDACLVCVPHYDHPRYAMLCMQKNIHVMVEKPVGVYTKQVRELNETAQKYPDVVFGLMFNQRTNPIYRKMHELVHSGIYGQLRRVNWIITSWYRPQAYYDSGDWRATWSGEGGGVLLNQCPHQLDLLQWICGMPVKVDAHLHYGLWHDIEVEDDVTAYLEYENKATGVFVTSTGDAHGSNRLEIQLDRAKLVAEHNELQILEFDRTEQEFSRENTFPFGTVPTRPLQIFTGKATEEHVTVLNAWGRAILHGGALIADGTEGIRGLTLSNAMHLSSWLEKPVTLPLDEELYEQELRKRAAGSRRKSAGKAVFADTSDTYHGIS